MKAEVVYAFDAATPDEISLQVGQIVDVKSVHDGGWGYGQRVILLPPVPGTSSASSSSSAPASPAGQCGYFPLSYVQFLRPPAKKAMRKLGSAEYLLHEDPSHSGDSLEDIPPPPPPPIEVQIEPPPQAPVTPLQELRITTDLPPPVAQQQQQQEASFLAQLAPVLAPRSPVSVSSFFDLNRSRIVEYRGGLPWAIPFAELALEDCIGAGAFGAVYRGSWRGETVAIKKMLFDRKQADANDQNAALTLFQKEAEFLRSFSHENIVEFKGACLDQPNLCLVMEYAENGSLFHYIKRNQGGIPPQRVLEWISDIARGMSYLVNDAPTPIIHRDLKSQNVLVTKNLRLKITDFGVAKAKPNHSTKMSTAGTFAWMAPEAIKFQNYSEASDVWSFGVILWELLTLEIPYANIEPYCIAYGVATRNLKLPIPSTCPQVFRGLLEQCWREGEG